MAIQFKSVIAFLALAIAMGCLIRAPLPTAIPVPAGTPVPFLARQLDVKINPKESAVIQLNPSPLSNGGYSQGKVVTIDILPKQGWQIDKWVGPVYNIGGTTAQIKMDYSQAVAVRLKPTTRPTPTPTTVPTTSPNPTATPRPTAKTSADSFFDNGMEYYDSENWSLAVEEFTLAIQIKFRLEAAYFSRGYSYYNLAQYQNAISDFTKAIRLNSDDALYYAWRGYVYSELGQYQNAITDYTEAIQLDPDDAMNYNNRGYMYWRISQKGKWREDQRKACSMDSQYC